MNRLTSDNSAVKRVLGDGREGRRTRAAFSLVEVMIAAGILGILILALLAGISYGISSTRMSRENQRATQVMLEKLEQFRLLNWQQVTTNGLPTSFIVPYYPMTNLADSTFNYTGTVSIVNAPLTEGYASTMRLVTVSISWVSGQIVRQRSASTLVASNGLFNYNY